MTKKNFLKRWDDRGCVYECLRLRVHMFKQSLQYWLMDLMYVVREKSREDSMVFGLSNFHKDGVAISWDGEDSPRSRFSEWVSEWVKEIENEWILIENAALYLYHSDLTNDSAFLSLIRPL